MPLQATSGAASYDAFGGGVPAVPNYIEDVFSTYLYTGAGSTNQNIVNGIDLAGKGGLVWIKDRSVADTHLLFDTLRGVTRNLSTAQTGGQGTLSQSLTSFNSNGFTGRSDIGPTGDLMASWTFREQPKFFDIVTWTGNGVNGRQIPHNLGSVPGCIIVKATSLASDWRVYHRSLGSSNAVTLNSTAASSNQDFWNYTDPTSTVFSVSNYVDLNGNGQTYVAYVFAHNAGGFGLTGTDNVISCGSYTGNATAGNAITLGYEPQWIMIKQASGTDAGTNSWSIYDNMRGMPNGSANDNRLEANNSNAEVGYPEIAPTATGFVCEATGGRLNASGGTYIYIAIRRGPMKVPTDGTKVFAPVNQTGGGTVTTNFPVDLLISTTPSQSAYRSVNDRLRGASTTKDVALYTNVTDAEAVGTGYGFGFDNNTGFKDANYSNSFTDVYWNLRRAPGFFDEVCYTNTGSPQQVAFTTLGTTPELVIYKARGTTSDWYVLGKVGFLYHGLKLNTTAASAFNDTAANLGITSTYFDPALGWGGPSSFTYVAYFFATCPGVQYINSYVGDGTTGRTINCGFTGGARFVCIKATSTTGSWWTFDSARGIVTNNDPALQLNSTAAEVTSADAIDTASSGFIVNQESTCSLNASGVSYLVWAIA